MHANIARVSYKLTVPDIREIRTLKRGVTAEGYIVATSVYKLKGCYLRLNTPLFPIHFRTVRAVPDIAFKVVPHTMLRETLVSTAKMIRTL